MTKTRRMRRAIDPPSSKAEHTKDAGIAYETESHREPKGQGSEKQMMRGQDPEEEQKLEEPKEQGSEKQMMRGQDPEEEQTLEEPKEQQDPKEQQKSVEPKEQNKPEEPNKQVPDNPNTDKNNSTKTDDNKSDGPDQPWNTTDPVGKKPIENGNGGEQEEEKEEDKQTKTMAEKVSIVQIGDGTGGGGGGGDSQRNKGTDLITTKAAETMDEVQGTTNTNKADQRARDETVPPVSIEQDDNDKNAKEGLKKDDKETQESVSTDIPKSQVAIKPVLTTAAAKESRVSEPSTKTVASRTPSKPGDTDRSEGHIESTVPVEAQTVPSKQSTPGEGEAPTNETATADKGVERDIQQGFFSGITAVIGRAVLEARGLSSPATKNVPRKGEDKAKDGNKVVEESKKETAEETDRAWKDSSQDTGKPIDKESTKEETDNTMKEASQEANGTTKRSQEESTEQLYNDGSYSIEGTVKDTTTVSVDQPMNGASDDTDDSTGKPHREAATEKMDMAKSQGEEEPNEKKKEATTPSTTENDKGKEKYKKGKDSVERVDQKTAHGPSDNTECTVDKSSGTETMKPIDALETPADECRDGGGKKKGSPDQPMESTNEESDDRTEQNGPEPTIDTTNTATSLVKKALAEETTESSDSTDATATVNIDEASKEQPENEHTNDTPKASDTAGKATEKQMEGSSGTLNIPGKEKQPIDAVQETTKESTTGIGKETKDRNEEESEAEKNESTDAVGGEIESTMNEDAKNTSKETVIPMESPRDGGGGEEDTTEPAIAVDDSKEDNADGLIEGAAAGSMAETKKDTADSNTSTFEKASRETADNANGSIEEATGENSNGTADTATAESAKDMVELNDKVAENKKGGQKEEKIQEKEAHGKEMEQEEDQEKEVEQEKEASDEQGSKADDTESKLNENRSDESGKVDTESATKEVAVGTTGPTKTTLGKPINQGTKGTENAIEDGVTSISDGKSKDTTIEPVNKSHANTPKPTDSNNQEVDEQMDGARKQAAEESKIPARNETKVPTTEVVDETTKASGEGGIDEPKDNEKEEKENDRSEQEKHTDDQTDTMAETPNNPAVDKANNVTDEPNGETTKDVAAEISRDVESTMKKLNEASTASSNDVNEPPEDASQVQSPKDTKAAEQSVEEGSKSKVGSEGKQQLAENTSASTEENQPAITKDDSSPSAPESDKTTGDGTGSTDTGDEAAAIVPGRAESESIQALSKKRKSGMVNSASTNRDETATTTTKPPKKKKLMFQDETKEVARSMAAEKSTQDRKQVDSSGEKRKQASGRDQKPLPKRQRIVIDMMDVDTLQRKREESIDLLRGCTEYATMKAALDLVEEFHKDCKLYPDAKHLVEEAHVALPYLLWMRLHTLLKEAGFEAKRSERIANALIRSSGTKPFFNAKPKTKSPKSDSEVVLAVLYKIRLALDERSAALRKQILNDA